MGSMWQDVLDSMLMARRLQSTEANLRLGTGADGRGHDFDKVMSTLPCFPWPKLLFELLSFVPEWACKCCCMCDGPTGTGVRGQVAVAWS
jgi:hypothetical protein